MNELARLRATAPPDFVGKVLAAVGLGEQCAPWASPVGPMVVSWTDHGVTGIAPSADVLAARLGRTPQPVDDLPVRLRDALDRRARGERASLRFDLRGLTEFERAVLEKALEIPFGEIRPYGWIAREIGRPAAVRAVGSALGRNPVPVVIPCHRVVRTDGRVGHYAFGRPMKLDLLRVEGLDPDAIERDAATGVRYVGSATTQVYCHPTCRHARRITERHRRPFPSAAVAEAAGFRPCKTCRPAAAA